MSEHEQSIPSNGYRVYCPHLGLVDDHTVMLAGASTAHRCFVAPNPCTPDLKHQGQYCLVANHVNCPFYQPGDGLPGEPRDAMSPVLEPARATKGTAKGTTQLTPSFAPPLAAPLAPPPPPALPVASTVIHTWQPTMTQLESQPGFRLPQGLAKAALGAAGVLLFVLLLLLAPRFLRFPGGKSPASAAQPAGLIINQAALESPTPGATDTLPLTPTPLQIAMIITPTATPVGTAAPLATMPTDRYVTPTAEPGGQVLYLNPPTGNVGWWMSSDPKHAYLSDSFLYAGVADGETYVAAMRFDLSSIPRGAPIRQVELRLTGLRGDRLVPNAQGAWLIQLIAENALKTLGGIDFLALYSAPASITLQPDIKPADVGVEKTNSWQLDDNARQWLMQQLLGGAKSVTVRILPSSAGANAVFAWDSGMGPETKGNAAALVVSLGPPPPTPPPLPTQEMVVATLTPVPDNVMTVVAQNQTATSVALTDGTYTPVPVDFVTPTAFPENLATVQAAAFAQGLPAVVQDTPTPFSAAQATGDAEYATAVALTTGTFTPVPTSYVTPMLVYPSPPAQNLATEAARLVQATVVAQKGGPTATPLPFNAVMAKYLFATDQPGNQATAAAQNVIATAAAKVNGTPTPLPWGVIVITAVPTPMPPPPATPTPLPSLQPVTDFTPTPTIATATPPPGEIPAYYHNKILFKTNRSGGEEIYALDPTNSELYRVNEPWVYPLAQQRLGLSPDGKYEALVRQTATKDKNEFGVKEVTQSYQIFTHSFEYDKDKQITTYQGISYDPAWSPTGNLIAFVSTNSGNDEIYTVTPDGSVVTQLTVNKFEWDKHPTWSPDGKQIVFMSNRETGRRQLWIMDADGKNQRNLTSDPYEDWEPIWVP